MPKLAQFRAKHEAAPLAGEATPILHVDMDAFFVSVELLDHPELRGKPVVVGGQPNRRGVVSAASYEARRFGIHSAMPLRTAGRLCPHAIFLEGRHHVYAQWSDKIASILARFSPVVEMASIDEAYLDLSGTERLHGPPLAAAHTLLTEIGAKTNLPVSAGLARTHLVAKVASDQAKPRGLLWVPAGAEESFLAPLSVRRIPGIGKVTEAALKNMGIERVEQLAAIQSAQLDDIFGQWGAALYRKARGQDSYEFFIDAEPKSISHSHTFSDDTGDRAKLDAMLSLLCQKAAKRLREAGLDARTITVTIRYAGFETVTRSKTLPQPTHLDPVLLDASRRLFDRHWNSRRTVRLVGVELASLTHGAGQLDLLDAARREKLEKLSRATDKLRDRFGFAKLQFGGSLGTTEPGEEDGDGNSCCHPERRGRALLGARARNERSLRVHYRQPRRTLWFEYALFATPRPQAHNHHMTSLELSEIVCRTLRDSGHQAYLVGGCVRDLILNRTPADYDVATDAHPDRVQHLFPSSVNVGARYGVILVVEGQARVEVSTFRSDIGYSDGRHPDRVEYSTTPQEDVRRRDFTINGLLLDPDTKTILDFVGGRQDIEARLIRAIGDPTLRFAEDKLRMLRAVRFAARLNYTIEPATFAAIQAAARQVTQVSPERIREELTKLLTEGAARRGFELLDETGLLAILLPEVARMKGVAQPPQYHPEGDVWIHTLMLLENLPPASTPTLAWGVLLHDVGKPPTFTSAEKTGDRIRFDGHDEIGARMAAQICGRLRFSTDDTQQIESLVAQHMRFKDVSAMRPSTLKRFVRQDRFHEHLALHRLDCLASHGKLDAHEFVSRFIAETPPEQVRPARLVTGEDLKQLGFSPGPQFKEILRAVEEAQLEGRLQDRDAALQFVRGNYTVN